MSPTDILDVIGATYTYLINGQPPGANWTALFRPGERVRLRFINGSSMSIFDVRIPGLPMTVVQADGNDVEPVTVDEFRISVAETYDVIVQPRADRAYTIFAQAEDRSGYARGTLAPRPGMEAPIPPMDPRPMRTMTDMGMGGMGDGRHGSRFDAGHGHGAMHGAMEHGSMAGDGGRQHPTPKARSQRRGRQCREMPTERLNSAGDGFPPGRRVLTYADLRATRPGSDPRPPSHEITLHLTGNMERFIWGFDGKKFSEAGPIELKRGDRVRFVLINDTMMEHPIHLHGCGASSRTGTASTGPTSTRSTSSRARSSAISSPPTQPGRWAYHCHLLYHMETGMFREVRVA